MRNTIDRPWLRHPLLLLFAAGMGAMFGLVVWDVRGAGVRPLGGLPGSMLGLLAGLVFVAFAFVLYRGIRDPLSGAIVMGLFAALAMGLVGGVFGAVVGLLAGAVCGAVVGTAKRHGGMDVNFPPFSRSPYVRRF